MNGKDLMTRNKGYGITNYTIQKKLIDMNKTEREKFELTLKNNHPKKYSEFKEWQQMIMKIIPEYKINY